MEETIYRDHQRTERARAREVLDRNERDELLDQIRYWRGMYGVLKAIIAHQKPDPAYEWLDELTRIGAVNLSKRP